RKGFFMPRPMARAGYRRPLCGRDSCGGAGSGGTEPGRGGSALPRPALPPAVSALPAPRGVRRDGAGVARSASGSGGSTRSGVLATEVTATKARSPPSRTEFLARDGALRALLAVAFIADGKRLVS